MMDDAWVGKTFPFGAWVTFTNDGVYGLRRATSQAFAGTLSMSPAEGSDESTLRLFFPIEGKDYTASVSEISEFGTGFLFTVSDGPDLHLTPASRSLEAVSDSLNEGEDAE